MRCFIMRLLPAALFVGVLQLGLAAVEAEAQVVAGYSPSYRVSDYLGAPGNFGMSYGFASYGMPQTYSVFSAYPGPSYGSNYPPYGILPGRFGVGLWRPGLRHSGICLWCVVLLPAIKLLVSNLRARV